MIISRKQKLAFPKWKETDVICLEIWNGPTYLGLSFLHGSLRHRSLVDGQTHCPGTYWWWGRWWRLACSSCHLTVHWRWICAQFQVFSLRWSHSEKKDQMVPWTIEIEVVDSPERTWWELNLLLVFEVSFVHIRPTLSICSNLIGSVDSRFLGTK